MPEKTIVTTSRDPSQRTRSFLKDLTNLAPWLIRVNRGKMTFQELVEAGIDEKAKTLVVIGEKKANPSIMRIYDLSIIDPNNLPLHAYTIFIKGISLSREKWRTTGPLKPGGIMIQAKPPRNDTERNLVLALYKIFGAESYTMIEKPNYLKIIVRDKPGFLQIDFKYTSPRQYVGPTIRVKEVKKIGRPSGPS